MAASPLERRIAAHREPLSLVREAIDETYRTAVREGDEALRLVALSLLCDLRRRRSEAGLPAMPLPQFSLGGGHG